MTTQDGGRRPADIETEHEARGPEHDVDVEVALRGGVDAHSDTAQRRDDPAQPRTTSAADDEPAADRRSPESTRSRSCARRCAARPATGTSCTPTPATRTR